jgi:hypothetical protein
MRARLVVLAVVLAANVAAASPEGRVVFTQVPVESGGLAAGAALPAGSRIVTFDIDHPGPVTVLTEGFDAAGRPDVSFDGERVLFVGRHSTDEPLNVWEMSTDGSHRRRITSQPVDCLRAIYLSTIYTINDDAPADQIAFCRRDATGADAIYTCRMDGTQVARITFDPYGATSPCQLSDGRLLYTGGSSSVLMTVNTDGTDVFLFGAADQPAAYRGMPCETHDGRVVYVESPPGGDDCGGALVSVSRTESLHSRRAVTDDPAGHYRSPAPLPGGDLLVSYREPRARSYGLYAIDPQDSEHLAGIFDAPPWHELDAVAVCARPQPAGRSSVVNERVDHGMLYCLDAYLTGTERLPDTGDDRIERLDVYRAVAAAHHRDQTSGGIAEELLGSAPVARDGSIHLKVPVRTPLRLETIGPNGAPLQSMDSWFWVMPGERRGCIGCHEDRELTPPNRHPMALRRAPTPVGFADEEEEEE